LKKVNGQFRPMMGSSGTNEENYSKYDLNQFHAIYIKNDTIDSHASVSQTHTLLVNLF